MPRAVSLATLVFLAAMAGHDPSVFDRFTAVADGIVRLR